MTPAARISAAIEVLDAIRAGVSAEQALTNWARRSRFAGSGDRAALRDHVFDVLRRWRSCAVSGGGETGRALMLGALRAQGIDPDTLFTGTGHAPAPLTAAERDGGAPPEGAAALDLPDWLWPRFQAALGAEAEVAAEALRHRAPVMLRVNPRRGTAADAIARLAAEGIVAEPCEIAMNALQVTGGERKIATSSAYLEGVVELQDGSSQAAMERLDVAPDARVLDYCAGGGGKTLALAARAEARWVAHDAAPERMKDLPARAARAGVAVRVMDHAALHAAAPFDLVLCDVPCSGSGTWRRTPEAKWRLTPERLRELTRLQTQILAEASRMVAPGGVLAYATCSVLNEENHDVISYFQCKHPEWNISGQEHWPISRQGDGFFLVQLCRVNG
ncbi:16S rRNA (cytosine967-C5)-methyltransferase [Roseovarius azorensis]|uniref:16S rRNA (Cytosine967-C5)-methyltransferase n=1 Tax=Roseovarius azorensis TaxID=1287727 RepID=A0A1H7TY98_9RHOB|nr:RsmB/NOP family class I SAM-dependent RNA methyltransferase [Roseovarius azorensis]SEL89711.1 16S rRNA (cytosine967-C5)-methyltransferase [Roseovarius azorensis]